jgi:hypothetical protein
MVKHVGKHDKHKVVVVYRKVPNEDHMCLVVYTEKLQREIHDVLMRVLESPAGQQADTLADVLFRNLLKDGTNLLTTLHNTRQIKKVATNQITITPNSKSAVKLDVLNKILDEMALGSDAAKRMKELDENAGMNNGIKNRKQAIAREQALLESQEQSQAEVLEEVSMTPVPMTKAEELRKKAQEMLDLADQIDAEDLLPKTSRLTREEKAERKITKEKKIARQRPLKQ